MFESSTAVTPSRDRIPGLQPAGAVDVVQGARRPAEVARGEPIAPDAPRVSAALGLHRQSRSGERPFVVGEAHAHGLHHEKVGGLDDAELDWREGAVDRHLRGAVLEPSLLAVLKPDKAGVEHGDPVVRASQDIDRVGHRTDAESCFPKICWPIDARHKASHM